MAKQKDFEMKPNLREGEGLYAKAPGIKVGTLVLSETPIVTTELTAPIEIYDSLRRTFNDSSKEHVARNLRKDFSVLNGIGDKPPRPPGARMPDLSNGPGQFANTRAEWYYMSLMSAQFHNRFGQGAKPEVATEYLTIFENNCFKIRNPQNTGDAWAVFKWSARLNHSCIPNCYPYWNPRVQQLCVYALRDINPGEQLFITYGDRFDERANERMLRLSQLYGFECNCDACNKKSASWETIENDRKEMVQLQESYIKHKLADDISKIELDKRRIARLKILAEQAAGTAWTVIAHILISKLQYNNNDFEEAAGRLKEARRLLQICCGEDHPKVREMKEVIAEIEKRKKQLEESCWDELADLSV